MVNAPGPLWDLVGLPAAMDPTRGILTFNGETISLEEFVAWAGAIAERLDGSSVALMDVNSHHAVLLMYACFLRGARFIPLNYRLRAHELGDILQRAGTPLLVFGGRYGDIAGEVEAGPWGGTIVDVGVLCAREAQPEAPPVPASHAGEGDVVLFTSGTSSAPKPIPLDAAPLSSYVMATTPACPPETRDEALLMSMPLYHVAGVVAILRAIFSGRRVVVLDQFEPRAWAETVSQERATHAFLVPTMMQRVLEQAGDLLGGLTSLKSVTYGGGPMPASIIAKALQQFPATIDFVGVYGLTEASGTVCVLDEADHAAARDGDSAAIARLASVGRPLPDLVVEVVDQDDSVVATGEIGEIIIRGPRLTSALVGDGNGERVLRTGDLGFLDDGGYLHFRGRADDMIVRGAENIAPREIEEVLLSSPLIAEAAVFGSYDETWGQSVVAAVVLAPGVRELDTDRLRQDLRSQLASYKWPERFIVLDRFPVTATGKVIKRELAAMVHAVADQG